MWYRVIRRKVTVFLVVSFLLITTKVFYSRDWGHKLPSGEVQEMPGKSATDGSDYQPLHNSRATESSRTGLGVKTLLCFAGLFHIELPLFEKQIHLENKVSQTMLNR